MAMGSSDKLLLDTNMLISLFRFGVDLGDRELFVTESVVAELRSMRSQHARAALNFVALRCGVLKSVSSYADADLIEVASASGCVLATNDRELRKSAKARGVRTAYLRGKKMLVIDGAAQI